MANFATEADVRLKMQLNDAALVPADLVNASIDAAHEIILRRLDPQYDVTPAAVGLVIGETLLAGSRLLQSLASRDAFEQKHVTIGGQRIEEGRRFAMLMAMAATAETEAWTLLAPFLLDCPGRVAMEASETAPILGDH